MRFYETMFVVKPTLTQEEITTKIDFYKTAILNNGGEISATLDMGMRNLAYEIKKNKRGYYFVIYFKAEPKLVLELERLYRINEDILRFIVIKYDSKKEQKAWEILVDRAIHNKKPMGLKESKDKEAKEEKIEDNKEQSHTTEV
ncbi:30S ribosomal protein S6 [Helicobacter mesocricetorum]|uniref:30S ribosomal protein S6 n=1 Tax=Helicobacter mesocricetorum TaxID=87012 RepID=UPI000CF1C432|nr:30S ribosomal protein S6 [Helicobacter mesocricetorum]